MNPPITVPAFNELYQEWGLNVVGDWHFTDSLGKRHTVPDGYWCNAGSIPKPFWQLTFSPFHPIMVIAALPHDWGYFSHVMPKAVADATLYMHLREVGAGSVKSAAIKTAVAMFGESSYQRDATDRQYLAQLRADIHARGGRLERYGL